ncbi:MAG: phosphoenolpyruvate carboxykinase (ATP), partial [Winogradskyella sp.]|nr:phosphoenolpyruvate carboxykinase (ATP) [Winogradskyella sp.]
MGNNTPTTKTISLDKYGIKNAQVHYQLTPKQLQEITVKNNMGKETANGTLAVNTGKFTGRSPEDRFLVRDEYTEDRIWWGKSNKPISPENFDFLQKEIESYLSGKEVYVRDGYV